MDRAGARAVWHDAAPSVEAVAELLQTAAEAPEGGLRLSERPVPDGVDPGLLHRAAVLVARRRLQAAHSESDRILAQEVRALDDLVRTANLLVERLREWYALHAPEATRAVADHEAFTRLVAEEGDRAAVMSALHDAASAATSLGTDLADADLEVLKGFAGALQGVHGSLHALERRIGGLMQEVAPNLAAIVGPLLGARMVAQAGSVERLALWPAGTVQTLGAETALFRHLKEGARPPKHGLLFQHPLLHTAPPWQRGVLARALASAAVVAARADAFTQNDVAATLRKRLDRDVERICRERDRPRPRIPPGGRKGTARGPSAPPRGPKPAGGPGRGARRGPGQGTKPGAAGGGPKRKPPRSTPTERGGGKPRKGPSDDAGRRPRKPGAFRGGGPARPPGRG